MRGLGSIPTMGNIFHSIFLFSRSKASDANIVIIAILVHFEKTLVGCHRLTSVCVLSAAPCLIRRM